jgi:hypothetical protein
MFLFYLWLLIEICLNSYFPEVDFVVSPYSYMIWKLNVWESKTWSFQLRLIQWASLPFDVSVQYIKLDRFVYIKTIWCPFNEKNLSERLFQRNYISLSLSPSHWNTSTISYSLIWYHTEHIWQWASQSDFDLVCHFTQQVVFSGKIFIIWLCYLFPHLCFFYCHMHLLLSCFVGQFTGVRLSCLVFQQEWRYTIRSPFYLSSI